MFGQQCFTIIAPGLTAYVDKISNQVAKTPRLDSKLFDENFILTIFPSGPLHDVDGGSDDVIVKESNVDLVDGLSVDEDYSREMALITNSEWLSVKATMTTLQQQIQMLRLQQFQLMQFLTPKSQSSANDQTNGNAM